MHTFENTNAKVSTFVIESRRNCLTDLDNTEETYPGLTPIFGIRKS